MIIKCSSCNKKLVEIIRANTPTDVVHKFVANCPFCGDKSFVVDMVGDLAIIDVPGCKHVDTKTEYVEKLKASVNYLSIVKG